VTTICTDGISMAGDSYCGGECFHTEVTKIARAKDGSILGYTGLAFDFDPFLKWYEGGGDLKVSEEFEGLILKGEGDILCVNEQGNTFVHQAPAAIGSGTRFAYGAMDAGASPEEAVAIAIKRDAFSGGRITSLMLSIADRRVPQHMRAA
jgi:hypothetical protein